MAKQRICCICGQDLSPTPENPRGPNYYRIDGVRHWCVPCGQQALKQEPKQAEYRARVTAALACVDTAKLEAIERKVTHGRK